MIYYFLNEDKTYRCCTCEEYQEQISLMLNTHTKSVDKTLKNDLVISTTWLGINHNFIDENIPLLFETMIFDKNGDSFYCKRYTTWDEAVQGHKNAIDWIDKGYIHE